MYGYPDEYPTVPARRGNRAAAVLLGVAIVFSAVWMGGIASWLLIRVTPAVLPGATFSVPLLTPAMERLPGGLAVSQPGPDHPFNQPVTILLMGVDTRPGESPLSARTDSIAVVRLDPVTERVTILSVPRDLWVVIHSSDGENYWQRINVSYADGADLGGSIRAGAEQLSRDLRANFGIQADHYVWLDMASAGRLIDAMGGVDVFITEQLAVPEWRYTEDDVTNPQVLSFPPGEHHLSGYEAVAFSRYRGDSDLFRAQRQQLVLRAVLENPFSLGLLLDPFAPWQVVESDLSVSRLAGLGLLASRASNEIEVYSLGEPVGDSPTVVPFVTAGGAAVLDWNPDNVAYWVAQAAATR